jgi:hypothetical protein
VPIRRRPRRWESDDDCTFDTPGDYILVQANDVSGEGGGGFQCCWTNAYVAVKVTSKGETR